MSNPDVARWRQRGRVFLWRYPDGPSSIRGWHFTADDLGCESLAELLRTFAESRWSASVEIMLTVTSQQIASVVRPDSLRSAATWRLALRSVSTDSREWAWSGTPLNPALTFGRHYLNELLEAVEAIASGRGDYAIGDGCEPRSELWVWWRREAKVT